MKLDLHYTAPQLVALYDINNPRGIDTDFYVQFAEDIEAKIIFDLGCGTGLLTRELVRNNRNVIGIDPSSAMLTYAKQQTFADLVLWKKGDASILGSPKADLVLMTGNVVQIFLDDSKWYATLCAIYSALRHEGYIAFESRNPAAKAWENWNRESTYKLIESPFGPIEYWLELKSASHSQVYFKNYYVFSKTGKVFEAESVLRFRSFKEIINNLQNIGFCIQHVYGNWNREPITKESKVMVFIAQRC
ncbi:MAG: class I SAM-dependent methyltransferase [Ignavibacteriaceae bacterium]